MQVKVSLTEKAYKKLKYYVSECDTEISGLGRVRLVSYSKEDQLYLFQIYDLEIIPQVVSSVHATITEQDLVQFMQSKIRSKISLKDYKVWWHSHAHFGAFFSQTDENTIDESRDFPYLISVCANKKGEIVARIDFFEPIRFTKEAEVSIESEEDEKLKKKIRAEIQRKISYSSEHPVVGEEVDSSELPPTDDEPTVEPEPEEEGRIHEQKQKFW